MEGKPLIRALLDLHPRDLVALAVVIVFVIAVSVSSCELADAVQAARNGR